MHKIKFRIKVFKRHPKDNGFTYKLWVKGYMPAVYQFAEYGQAPNFSNFTPLLLKSL